MLSRIIAFVIRDISRKQDRIEYYLANGNEKSAVKLARKIEKAMCFIDALLYPLSMETVLRIISKAK